MLFKAESIRDRKSKFKRKSKITARIRSVLEYRGKQAIRAVSTHFLLLTFGF
jgi:hypothetical protein